MFPVLFIPREAVIDWRMLSLFSALRIINPETHNQGFPISMLYRRSVFLKMLYTLPYSHPWRFIYSKHKSVQGYKCFGFFLPKDPILEISFQPILRIPVWSVLVCLPQQQLTATGLIPASEGHGLEVTHHRDRAHRRRHTGAPACLCSSQLTSRSRLAISHISVVYITQ